MITVELEEDLVKQLRNYFGSNDKTSFEHLAFKIFDDAIKQRNQ